MSDADYAAEVSWVGAESKRDVRLWRAEVRWVEVLDALEEWRELRGHVTMLRLLGRWKRAPSWARVRLEELETRAVKRSGS